MISKELSPPVIAAGTRVLQTPLLRVEVPTDDVTSGGTGGVEGAESSFSGSHIGPNGIYDSCVPPRGDCVMWVGAMV